LGEYWKFRVGSYRLICNIDDATRTVLVLQIGDRKEVYR
jgi:mRNA interferase RelE/StbE